MGSSAEATGYSKILSDILCKDCVSGFIREGPGGRTQILCRETDYKEVRFPVTRCTEYERKSLRAMHDQAGVIDLMLKDGHVLRRQWCPEKGMNIWVRAVKDGKLLDPSKQKAEEYEE